MPPLAQETSKVWVARSCKGIAVHLPYPYSLLCLGVDYVCERELWSDPIQLLSWQMRYSGMFTQDEQSASAYMLNTTALGALLSAFMVIA